MSLLISMFFIGVPIAQYMTLRSQNTGVLPLSYLNLVQIYAYSMFSFIPSAFLYCIFIQFERVKWLLLLCSVGVSCYYTYKETFLIAQKYLTLAVFKRLAIV